MFNEFNKKGDFNTDINMLIPKFRDLSKEDKIELIYFLIKELRGSQAIGHEVLAKKEINIPIGIFSNDALSSLEAIVKYMKENLKLKFSKIGKLLNRSNKTVWTTYHNSIKKMPSSFETISTEIIIPVSVFSNRSFSTLESVVAFLKDLDYSNHEVALMLHLDDRTIWTVYDRVKKKRGIKIDAK